MRAALCVIVILAAAAPAWTQDRAAPSWPDERTGRMIDRYLEVLLAHPAEGDVFRSLANVYDAAGRLDALAARLERLAADDPKSDAPLVLLGHLERWRGRPDAARAAYERAVARNAEGYVARASLARALEETDRPAEAEAAWKEALARVDRAAAAGLDARDETVRVCRALGRLAINAGRPADARAWWDRLVALDPADLSRREELARILAENRLVDDAVKTLEDVVARSADDPERRARAAREIGRVLDAAGRPDDALAAFARALDLASPGNWMRRQVRADLFDLCERSGKLVDLEKRLAADAAKSPDDAETWQELLRVHTRTGNRAAAAEAFASLARLKPDDLDLRRRRAAELADAGDWTGAAGLLRDIARREPKDAKAQLDLARALRASGDAEGTLKTLDALAADFDKDPAALSEIARALEATNEFARAEKALRRAAELAPDDVASARELGAFLRRRGRPDDAASVLRAFARAHAKSADAQAGAGRVFRDWGLADDALDALRKSAELVPGDAARWRDLAQAAFEAGRPDDAARAWEQSAARASSDRAREEAWEQIISIYQGHDRLEALVDAWRRDAAKNPDDALPARRLGRALERMGRIDPPGGATGVYEEFLRHRPDDAPVTSALARARAQAGETAKAAALYERLVALDPAGAREHLGALVSLYLDQRRGADAAAVARRITEKFPFDPSAHADLARALESTGKHAEAAEAWRRALELRPGDRALTESLARALESAGDGDALMELHRRVLRSSPSRDACLASARTLIRLAFATPEFAAVERLLAARLAQDRVDFTWPLALAEFYRADEQPEKIEPLYRAALDAVGPAARGEVLDALSRQAEDSGDAPGAVRWMEERRRAEGSLPRETLPRLGALYLAAGRAEEGRRALAEWALPEVDNPETHRAVAQICRRHGDLEGAVAALERVLALPPVKPDLEGEMEHHAARIEEAELCEQLGRMDAAARRYLDVLDRAPEPARPKPQAQATPAGALFAAPITPGPMPPPPPPGPWGGPRYNAIRGAALEALVRIHLDAGRLDELLVVLEKRVASNPTRASYHADLARALTLAGETEKLVAALERARKTFPASSDTAQNLARAYRQAGRLDDALRELDAAVEIDPALDASLEPERIEMLLALGRDDDVRKRVRGVFRVEGLDRSERARRTAEQCAEAGKWELAASLLDETIANVGEAEVALNLQAARYWKHAQKRDVAVGSARRFVDSTRPIDFESTNRGAMPPERARSLEPVVRLLGRSGAARLLEDLHAESTKRPDSPGLLLDVAVLEIRLGRAADFARTCARLTALRPDDAWATWGLRELQRRRARADARAMLAQVLDDPACRDVRARVALAAIERMEDLAPDEPLTRRLVDALDRATPAEGLNRPAAAHSLAGYFWSHDRRDEAIRRLRARVTESPLDVETTLTLAGRLRVTGAVDEAQTLARRAAALVALPPESPDLEAGQSLWSALRRQLADVLDLFDDAGLLPALRERAAKALADVPDEPLLYCALAAVDERLGRGDAVIDTLRRLVARRPDDVSARLGLAEALEDAGRHAEAIAEFERAAASEPPQRELLDRVIQARARAADFAGELAWRERAAALLREPRLLADVAREYRARGMKDHALATFRRGVLLEFGASALTGTDASAARDYAQFLRQSGLYERGARLAERALAVARVRGTVSGDVDALRFELALDYEALGRLDVLIRRCEARLAEAPDDVATMEFLSALCTMRAPRPDGPSGSGGSDDARAIELRRGIARRRPRDLNNATQLALALRRAGRIDEAVEAWRRLAELDPANAVSAIAAIAEMRFEQGDTPKALEAARQMVAGRDASPERAGDRLPALARLYARMGLRDIEIETWRRAIDETRGTSEQNWAGLVRALVARPDVPGAVAAAEKGIELSRENLWSPLIVEALLSGGSVESLLAAAEGLLDSEPAQSSEELAQNIAQTLHERLLGLGRQDLAADVAVRAWRKYPDASPMGARAAREMTATGRFAEAERFLEEVLRETPGDAEARLERVRLLASAGRTAEAERAADEFAARRPTAAARIEAAQALADEDAWAPALARLEGVSGPAAATESFAELRAVALERTGQTDRAAAAWEDLMARFPGERSFVAAGRFYLATGRLDRAEAALRRLDPPTVDAAQVLGETLRRAGKHGAAAEMYRRLAESQDDAWVQREFAVEAARLERESGRADAARDEAERALAAADDEWARAAMASADAAAADGRRDEAAALYRKLATVARDATMRQRAAAGLAGISKPPAP